MLRMILSLIPLLVIPPLGFYIFDRVERARRYSRRRWYV